MPPVTHIVEPLPLSAHTAEQGRCARLAGLFEALPAAVLLLDGHGRVVEANGAARELFADALIGRPWHQVVAERFEADAGADLRLRDGRLLSLATRPLPGQPGQLLMFSDVTEERRMARALGQHKRLIDMGRMAAALAHQIRTPLSAATLYLSRLAGDDLDPERSRRFSARALERLRELERLIGDMLLFARGERGAIELVRVGELLQRALAPLKAREIHVEVAGDALGDELRVNPTLIASALQNLINNAADALGQGGHIRLLAERADGAIHLVVEDDGPGVPEAQRETLFEPFVSHRPGGTGLGLAVVRAVALAHQGDIELGESVSGGARFSLRLPVKNTP